jgi:hypothetical protein
MAAANHPERKPPRRMPSTSEGNRVIRDGDADAPTRSSHNGGRMDRHDIFMTASLDFAESQCIRSERQVTSCRGGRTFALRVLTSLSLAASWVRRAATLGFHAGEVIPEAEALDVGLGSGNQLQCVARQRNS